MASTGKALFMGKTPSVGKAPSAGKAAPSRDIIPGRLAWAPEQLGVGAGASIVPALELCRHGAPGGSKAGEYRVHHYPASARGRAFGPFNLESTLRFCRGLDARLEALPAGGEPLVLGTPPGAPEYRTNAAVLLGAYLILRLEWSSVAVASCLGAAQADAKFACAWASKDKPEPQRNMRVWHCWQGLELARQRRWIAADCLRDDAEMEKACQAYEATLSCYDCAWIIPKMLMVGADPRTVIVDPNPATCPGMFPPATCPGKFTPEDSADASTCSPEVSRQTSSMGTLPGCDVSEDSDCDSCDTVCKEYDVSGINIQDSKAEGRDFVTFLRQSRIGMVVKANFDKEQGMPGRSCGYTDSALGPHGICQASIPVEDTNGGLPKPSDVRRLLDACDGLMQGQAFDSDAVMVHCKGGFGRSVILASCLAISRLDIPGDALLGWIRIVRPGSFTVSKQESFLASLRGRRDVLRYAKIASEENRGSVNVSCGMPCQVQ